MIGDVVVLDQMCLGNLTSNLVAATLNPQMAASFMHMLISRAAASAAEADSRQFLAASN
jgi:cytochrome bd-type quinol oxidase subunit 1